MRGAFRTVLVFAAGAAAMLALERVSSRRGWLGGNPSQRLLDLIRPRPVDDDTIEARVRRKLARTARDPDAITVAIEHGCVDLRGPVETRERARIVRAVSTVPGVDSVLDLMTEPSAGPESVAIPPRSTEADPFPRAPRIARTLRTPRTSSPRPPPAPPGSAAARATKTSTALVHVPTLGLVVAKRDGDVSRWLSPAARILAIGAGLGLSLSAFKIGGKLAVPVGAFGLALAGGGAASAVRKRRGQRGEPDGTV
jgi:hypothetical protein